MDSNSSTLSISSKSIKNCDEVLNFFHTLGIPCSITENKSVVPYKDRNEIEIGCRIKMAPHNPKLINTVFWNKVKKKFDLTCAHLHVEGKYKGCIYDYIRPTNCPGQ